MYRVFIPGYGNIYVQAGSPDAALEAARRYRWSPRAAEAPPCPMARSSTSGSTPDTSSSAPEAPPGGPVNTIGEQEFIDPAAAFRAFAQSQGLPTGGVLGNFLQGAVSEPLLRNLGELRGAAQGATGGIQDFSLGDFFKQNIGQNGVLRGLGNAALGDLRSIAGNAGALTSEPFTNITDFGSEGAQAVRRGAQAGLTGRNPFFGSQFGNQLDQSLGRRFNDMVFRGQQPSNFIDYALSNFGLF